MHLIVVFQFRQAYLYTIYALNNVHKFFKASYASTSLCCAYHKNTKCNKLIFFALYIDIYIYNTK